MNVSGMLADLNQEIARLMRIRDLLLETAPAEKRSPGRPKGSRNQAVPAQPSVTAPKRRTMSAEAREKIAVAQRKRWAAGKKASPSASRLAGDTTPRHPAKAAKKAGLAKKAAGKSAPPKKAVTQAPVKKQSAAKTPPPAANEATTAGE